MREIRFLLIGLGNLGRRFCELLVEKDVVLQERYGFALRLVGAADSRGTAYSPEGLSPALVAQLKREGRSIADYPDTGRPGESALALVMAAEADLLLEASPVNLSQGAEPGLSCIRAAMQKGMHVSTPNKGPLVVAFRELHELAAECGVKLRFDGTVAGGLPAINSIASTMAASKRLPSPSCCSSYQSKPSKKSSFAAGAKTTGYFIGGSLRKPVPAPK